MWHVLRYLQKAGQVGWRSTALLNVMLMNQRLNGDEAVGRENNGFSNMSRVQGDVLQLGFSFTTREKNHADRRNPYYKEHTSCFQTALKHLHRTIQNIQKVSCF